MDASKELNALLKDPSTPFWAKDVVLLALGKDPVDAAKVLRVLAQLFERRAQSILKQGE